MDGQPPQVPDVFSLKTINILKTNNHATVESPSKGKVYQGTYDNSNGHRKRSALFRSPQSITGTSCAVSAFTQIIETEDQSDRSIDVRRIHSSSNPALARAELRSMPTREMLFLVAGANVDLHVLVADAANDITAKLVAAVMSAGGMSVEDSYFAAGPTK